MLCALATHRPVCLSMSSIFVWNTGSTASTETPVPLCGIAKTSRDAQEEARSVGE
jgi:hypothetical protein